MTILHLYISYINFAKYCLFSYKMTPPGKVQVPGFCNTDTYQEIIAKGAQGLGIHAPTERLSLMVSNGLVRDAPLPGGQQWTLGNYTEEFGGVQARGKHTFGIFVSIEVGEEKENKEENSESGDEKVRYPRLVVVQCKVCFV